MKYCQSKGDNFKIWWFSPIRSSNTYIYFMGIFELLHHRIRYILNRMKVCWWCKSPFCVYWKRIKLHVRRCFLALVPKPFINLETAPNLIDSRFAGIKHNNWWRTACLSSDIASWWSKAPSVCVQRQYVEIQPITYTLASQSRHVLFRKREKKSWQTRKYRKKIQPKLLGCIQSGRRQLWLCSPPLLYHTVSRLIIFVT